MPPDNSEFFAQQIWYSEKKNYLWFCNQLKTNLRWLPQTECRIQRSMCEYSIESFATFHINGSYFMPYFLCGKSTVNNTNQTKQSFHFIGIWKISSFLFFSMTNTMAMDILQIIKSNNNNNNKTEQKFCWKELTKFARWNEELCANLPKSHLILD